MSGHGYGHAYSQGQGYPPGQMPLPTAQPAWFPPQPTYYRPPGVQQAPVPPQVQYPQPGHYPPGQSQLGQKPQAQYTQYYAPPPPQQQQAGPPPLPPRQPQPEYVDMPEPPRLNPGAPPLQQFPPPPPPPPPPYPPRVFEGSSNGMPLQQPPLHQANAQPQYAPPQNQLPPPRPPGGPQQFGSGAPEHYHFQYSQCTGQHKALLIGINYFGQRGELRGCINDVRNMSAFLVQHHGWRMENMVLLTDDQRNPMCLPTKQNILRAMYWLVKDAKPNDSLFFHYSGHGGQTKDLDGDEADGYDEVIYPVDFRQFGHIVDDEMHDIMVKPLQPGVRLTAIFDSCHSGTALDLPYIYSTQGILKEPNLAKDAGISVLGAITSYARGDMAGIANSVAGFVRKAVNSDTAHIRSIATKTSAADVIMFSGSKDNQTSADSSAGTQSTGAMSWAFITALKKNPQQSYVQLLKSIRDELAQRFTQKPQLSCCHPLDTNLLFVM